MRRVFTKQEWTVRGKEAPAADGAVMKTSICRVILSLFFLTSSILVGCGGGGGGDTPATTVQPPAGAKMTLAWDPPTVYSDNTAMDAMAELDYYEFYVRHDTNFSDADAPAAEVKAVADLIGPDGQTLIPTLTNTFSLGNLLPFTPPGSMYYISIRAVGIGGLKSQFSVPIAWDLT